MRMSRKLAMRCGGIPLKTLAVGSSVWLNENETAAEYIVLAHDYPVSGGTLVMRKIAIGSITTMTDLQKEQIKILRLQGIGYVKIGEMIGISDNTVRSFCRRNGLGDTAKNTVACKQCGKLIKIIPKRKPRKCCSDACRNAWWNSHPDCVDRKAVYAYTCAHCGKPFTAYGNKERKYCSHECYIADRFGEERGCCD